MSVFTNLYYKRTAATQRPCYMCNRMTTTVLATKDSVDFFYACDGHLADREFATQLGEDGDGVQPQGARKLGVSDEEIRKVKEEYEERQRRKKEKGKENGEDKGKEMVKEDGKTVSAASSSSSKDSESTNASSAVPADKKDKDNLKTSASPSPTPTPKPATVHERYALHRAVFNMRLDIHRRKRQSSQAKEVAPRLPSAPRGAMSTS